MREHPLAQKQGTVCSGFIDDAMHCKHGHHQTDACTPYVDPRCGEWLPKSGPVCVIGDKHKESRFHRAGE